MNESNIKTEMLDIFTKLVPENQLQILTLTKLALMAENSVRKSEKLKKS